MTEKQAAEWLKINVNYLKKNYWSIKESLAKRGIELDKVGRGPTAAYSIKYPGSDIIK